VMFVGHYHRWLPVSSEGLQPWAGRDRSSWSRGAAHSWPSMPSAVGSVPCSTPGRRSWSRLMSGSAAEVVLIPETWGESWPPANPMPL
jgi:hypothetical protein